MEIPLTLNGNTFVEIQDLEEGKDYVYDGQTETVIVKADYINRLFDNCSGYGSMGEMIFRFSSGALWHEKLVKFTVPVFQAADGTVDGLAIPVDYNGAQFRRISAFSGEKYTGPHSDWWKYLENSYAYQLEEDSLTLDSRFFDECAEGDIRLVIEFFDGQTVELQMTKEGDKVSVKGN